MSPARLVHRMRPRSLSEVVGQAHLLDKGRPLGDALRAERPHGFVAWGPPGTGKSVVIALAAEAVGSSAAAIRGETCDADEVRRMLADGPGVLCIEALHRLSAEAQDALLPGLDNDLLVFATSAVAPERALSPSLRSRLAAYRFRPLSPEALGQLLERTLAESAGALEPAAGEYLVAHARGDGRVLLDALARVLSAAEGAPATLDDAVRCTAPDRADYPVAGTGHFDVVTAFVKSMRGSDPDATLYWLACMLEAGEDGVFIADRIALAATEDVGLADPFALVLARAVADCVARLPIDEARMHLAQAAVYVATAPKSGAVARGLEKACLDVRARGPQPVPLHLRQRTLSGAPELGYSQGAPWRQPKGQFLFPQYLPDGKTAEKLYEPTDSGAETRVRERLRAWWPERF